MNGNNPLNGTTPIPTTSGIGAGAIPDKPLLGIAWPNLNPPLGRLERVKRTGQRIWWYVSTGNTLVNAYNNAPGPNASIDEIRAWVETYLGPIANPKWKRPPDKPTAATETEQLGDGSTEDTEIPPMWRHDP